jgi:hypothetical protein
LCQWEGLARSPPSTPRSMTMMSAASTASARPGCGALFAGGANFLSLSWVGWARVGGGKVGLRKQGQKTSLSDFALVPLELARLSL